MPLKNTSAQLQQLRAAHLVTARKDGTRVYYRLADPGTLVLDVRSPGAFAAGHVPGAASAPLRELEDRLGELPGGKEIIAYCGGPYCVVSPRAVELLRGHGFPARPLVLATALPAT